MSEIYKDYIPANARVVVDYSAKEKVKFTFPIDWTYKKAVWKRAFPCIYSLWHTIHFLPIIYISFILIPFMLIKIIFFPSILMSEARIEYIDFLHVVLPMLLGVFYLMGIPAIFTFILSLNKDRMSRWLPKIGYWSSKLNFRTCEKIFNKDDIHKNKCSIPIFSNVYLHYKGIGDFNKYLYKIEILEIPFSYKKRNVFLPFLMKKERNDFEFSAVFYFSKRPIQGELKVEFI